VGEDLPLRVAATIETYVSLLRRRLGHEPWVGRRLLVTEPGGYRLAAEELRVDADRFDELVRRAAVASLPSAERRWRLRLSWSMASCWLTSPMPSGCWRPATTIAPGGSRP
jgi:hypothetical protein